VSLQDINMRKPFKSSIIKEQQVISKSTRPQSVVLMYQHCCEPAPALHILDPYRSDPVTCVHLFVLFVMITFRRVLIKFMTNCRITVIHSFLAWGVHNAEFRYQSLERTILSHVVS